MLDGDLYEPTLSKSGRILHIPPSTYLPWVGNYAAADTGQTSGVPIYTRAFFSFDTSNIPDHAQIETVAFRFRRRSDPSGEPDTYRLKISIGTFIGAALESSDWSGGTLMLTLYQKPADKDLVDLSNDGEDPTYYINRIGETDVRVWDDSDQGSGDPDWYTNLNKSVSELCKLEITWTLPSATVTGKGHASAAATLLLPPSSATATGAGYASGAATLLLPPSSATATGAGYASASATVLLPPSSATATGAGYATGEATLLLPPSAGTATGTGYASAAATLLLPPSSATATGYGYASAAATLLLPGASATATGYAYAYARPDLPSAPALARHVATISVSTVDTATISVSTVDTATISVSTVDTATISIAGDSRTFGARSNEK